MASAIHFLTSFSRRLTALGWKCYVAASLALLVAASVIFGFSAPSPVTARSSFSPSDGNSSSHDIKPVSFTGSVLAAPPSDMEILISPTSPIVIPPTLAPVYNSTNLLEHGGGNPDIPPLQEIPQILPTTVLSPANLTLSPSPAQSIKSKELVTFTEVDKELIYANMEITNAPPIQHDPDLHAPLFKNVSAFKRSYELMENMLKVYIYRDGRRPVFHTPILQGIYASEGWFLKLMEANTKFVVKDPKKAHLFYLPYNSRRLQAYVYRPNPHDLKPLAVYMKDYVEWISSRYPFWNRTRGADHFLVACHDWGPYTTRLHPELNRNTIKALCNADLTEGFVKGKDVSLPETYVRNPRKLSNDLGGKRVSKRSILAFFAGKMHGRVRPVLISHWLGKDEDMKIYEVIPTKIAKKMSYIQHMKSSKFCICPMGYEVNSPRIVEAIHYECVPVILADNFVLPFYEVLDWSAFSIVVAESDIARLKKILLAVSRRKYFAMHENVRRLRKHFVWNLSPEKYDIFHMILHSVWHNRLNHVQHGE